MKRIWRLKKWENVLRLPHSLSATIQHSKVYTIVPIIDCAIIRV